MGHGADVTWNATGGKVVHFAYTHPKVAIGLGLGALSVATGGVGFAADLAFEGTALTTAADATALGSGVGASVLDTGACRKGEVAACVGAGLGFAGAGLGAPAVAGDLLGVEANTLPFVAIKGASAFGLNLGIGGLVIDSAVAPFSPRATANGACP